MSREVKLNAKVSLSKFDKLFLGGEAAKVVREKLAEALGEELDKVAKENIFCLERCAKETMFDDNTHYYASVTVIHPKTLKELKENNIKLDSENAMLRKEIEKYKKLGMADVLDVMKKAEIMQEFCSELEKLSNHYTKKMEV